MLLSATVDLGLGLIESDGWVKDCEGALELYKTMELGLVDCGLAAVDCRRLRHDFSGFGFEFFSFLITHPFSYLMSQMQKVLHESPQGALPSNTEPNPREQVNSITTRSGLTTAEPSIPPHVPPTPRVEVEKEL
ncbi:hypothetical protein Tco_1070635 [Tanacetum coccineum]|uniref:Pentatricopeptide repeat-containing protein n=1 Tax=Tanacetum coccineum TaxID=301880 RepID=A0ABQ5HM35_9ASTR